MDWKFNKYVGFKDVRGNGVYLMLYNSYGPFCKIMKINVLAIFLLIIQTTSGQTFVSDWTTFSNSKWGIEFLNISKPYFSKTTQGQMTFQNKQNPNLKVVYYVLLKSDYDSLLKREIYSWNFVQSCATLINDKIWLESFFLNNYYYDLKPCHYCHTWNNQDCADLAEQLNEYISRNSESESKEK